MRPPSSVPTSVSILRMADLFAAARMENTEQQVGSRLNFYDVYGYLIPGAVLLSLLWLPEALVDCRLPPIQLSFALPLLILAYVVGHILHWFAAQCYRIDHFSDRLLSGERELVTASTWESLCRRIRGEFRIDVRLSKQLRGEAFTLCRARLRQRHADRYPEQFQALYTLVRSLTAACALGASLCFGWASAVLLTHYRPESSVAWFGACCSVWLILAWPCRRLARGASVADAFGVRIPIALHFWVTCTLLACIGFARGQMVAPDMVALLRLVPALWILVYAYSVFSVSYGRHMEGFARSVLLDFLSLPP